MSSLACLCDFICLFCAFSFHIQTLSDSRARSHTLTSSKYLEKNKIEIQLTDSDNLFSHRQFVAEFLFSLRLFLFRIHLQFNIAQPAAQANRRSTGAMCGVWYYAAAAFLYTQFCGYVSASMRCDGCECALTNTARDNVQYSAECVASHRRRDHCIYNIVFCCTILLRFDVCAKW